MARIRLLLTCLALCASSVALAQTSFVVESIEVESGARVASIVRAETRLIAGRTYSEGDVQQAVYRVRRLPFVTRADYQLKPGKSADSRVLVISIADERRLSFTADVNSFSGRGDHTTASEATAGYRFFTPGSGVLETRAGGSNQESFDTREVSVRYSAYGLFGTSAFAQVGASRSFGDHDIRASTLPSLLVGIPLTRTQTLQATYERATERLSLGPSTLAEPVIAHQEASSFGAAWLYETNDDPLFARSGTVLSVGPQWSRTHGDSIVTTGLPDNPVVQRETETYRTLSWIGRGEQYWPVREAFAVFTSANAQVSHVASSSSRSADVFLGGAWNGSGGDAGRYRFELGAGYGKSRFRTAFDTYTDSGAEAVAGFAYRGRWGTVHLTATVAHNR